MPPGAASSLGIQNEPATTLAQKIRLSFGFRWGWGSWSQDLFRFSWVGRVSGCRVCRGTVALARMFRRGKCVYRGDDGGVGDTDEDEKKNAGKCTTEVVCFMEKAHTLVPPHANTVPQQLGSILCALSKRIYIIKAKP